MFVGKAFAAVFPPARAVVAFHHLDRFLTGEFVDVGPLTGLVGLAVPVGRPWYLVFGQAEVGRDAPLCLQPVALVALVFVAVEIDEAVFFIGPTAVGVVAADVAGPGVESEPSLVAQLRGLEACRRRRGVRLLQG